jgi:hypothetical protein
MNRCKEKRWTAPESVISNVTAIYDESSDVNIIAGNGTTPNVIIEIDETIQCSHTNELNNLEMLNPTAGPRHNYC